MIHPVRAREVVTRWISASPATRVGGPVAALLLGVSGLFGGLDRVPLAERVAEVKHPVHLAYADVTVDPVRTAKTLNPGQGDIGTPGRWLVVDLTVVAWGRPLAKPGISLEDTRGRSFLSDARSGYSFVSAPTGVPWRVRIPFEAPACRTTTVPVE